MTKTANGEKVAKPEDKSNKCRSASCLIPTTFDATSLTRAAEGCLANLGSDPDLVLAFVTSDYRKNLSQLIEILQIDGHASRIVGATGSGLYGFQKEHENTTGISLLFLKLPKTEIKIFENPSNAAAIRLAVPDPAGFFLFGNPVASDAGGALPVLHESFPEVPLVGGCAAGGPGAEDVFVFTESGIVRSGELLLALSGPLRVVPLVSQGCSPIGEPFVVTGSRDENVLTIGRKEAFSVLAATWEALPDELQAEAVGNICAGLAINEQVDHYDIGNFLIRHIVSTDLEKGWLELADSPREGQTMQFQMRDGSAAGEELRKHCRHIREQHGTPFAGVLCGGQGRGKQLYDAEDRDVRLIEEHLGTFPLAGFFSNGEFGPSAGSPAFQEHSLCGAFLYPAGNQSGES